MSRILLVSHGHPEFSVGGGEIAAYRQAQVLRELGHEVVFLARSPQPAQHCGSPFSVAPSHKQDVLFHPPHMDHFLHSQRAKWAVYKQFRALLDRFRPEVIHFHHFVHLGVEMLREARKYSPTVPIVLTLHEYLAICNNHGQMVKTGGGLCDRASPAECHGCFTDIPPQEFFLREGYLRSFLDIADAYVCPSRFLLERYVAWGLPREKLHVIENGQRPVPPAEVPPAEIRAEEAPDLSRRFAMFGQISELKGALVFLDAIRALPEAVRAQLDLAIYGSTAHQSEEFQTLFAERLDQAGGQVRFLGPYRRDALGGLMRRTGWVVVPSIWWENSPLVIQEAFNHRRPVICSNIGGMAEKVTHGRDGLHFIAGNAADLAACLEQALTAGLWARLQAGITPPVSSEASAAAHLALYASSAGRAADPPAAEPVLSAARAAPAGRSRRRSLEAQRAAQ